MNEEIIKQFYEVADILSIKEDMWRARSYRTAARAIEILSKDLCDMTEKEIHAIPGVGESITKKILEYCKTGRIKTFIKLKKTIPKDTETIMNIPGMGPKKAKKLMEKLGIRSIADLKKAAKEHRIAALEGFGEKSEQDIIRNLGIKEIKGRRPLKEVLPIANRIKRMLMKLPEVKKIEIAGSIRRRKATIRDIDILVQSNKPEKIMNKFTKNAMVKTVLAKGKTKAVIVTKQNIQADLRVITKESWGAALAYFTGPKDHNIKLRQIAIKKGLKLSEYGIFNRKTGKQIAGKTEKEIYKTLGKKYKKPEER